jgi:hypothetical protein
MQDKRMFEKDVRVKVKVAGTLSEGPSEASS